MKILHLLASPFFTGPAELVIQLALAQRQLGHQVEVAVDRRRSVVTSEELLVPRLQPLGLVSGAGLELSVKSKPWAMLRDVRRLKSLSVDVVHSHFSHDHTLARWGTPKQAVLIRSIHAPRSVRWALPRANGFTVPMSGLARKLLGQRVFVLPALVGKEFAPCLDRSTLRRELGLSSHGRILGMVSTFQPSRRHALALEAFARLARVDPSLRLVLIGDGPLENELKMKAARLGEAVLFVGYQSGGAFVRYLQALDEVWLLGLGNDWSGRAAAQARACGTRVVAVDEGDLSRHADVVVEPTVDALVAASGASGRTSLVLEPPLSVARRLVAFYDESRP